VRLAPAGYHLLVDDGHEALACDAAARHSRPSIDVLLASAARAHGPRAVGVVLTGANDDGARGPGALRERGGHAIVREPEDAEAPAMPRAALRRAGADAVVALDAVAQERLALAGRRAR
jgi:two-component system chemotaxis response regulator CheB